MKLATALTVIAVGAILAFAVRTNPPGLNIHTVGWVGMLTGAAGLLLPDRASGWLRRRIVRRRVAAEPVVDESDQPGGDYPHYVVHDPAAVAAAILRDAEMGGDAADEPADPATTARLKAVKADGEEAAGPSGTLDDLLGRAGGARRR